VALRKRGSLPFAAAHANRRNERGVNQDYPHLDQARRASIVLTVFTLIVFVWAGYFPDSYGFATSAAILLPWVALVLLVKHPALYRLNPSSNDEQRSLWMPFCLTGLPLALRAFTDAHVIDDEELFWLCLAVTLVCLALLAWALREVREMRRQWGEAALLGLCLFFYVYGVMTLANRELDRGAPEIFTVTVLGTRVAGEAHYLRLTAWGPSVGAEEVDVGEKLYARTSIGDRRCVALGTGTFGVRWFYVDECRSE
jgi:hypothetical protein